MGMCVLFLLLSGWAVPPLVLSHQLPYLADGERYLKAR